MGELRNDHFQVFFTSKPRSRKMGNLDPHCNVIVTLSNSSPFLPPSLLRRVHQNYMEGKKNSKDFIRYLMRKKERWLLQSVLEEWVNHDLPLILPASGWRRSGIITTQTVRHMDQRQQLQWRYRFELHQKGLRPHIGLWCSCGNVARRHWRSPLHKCCWEQGSWSVPATLMIFPLLLQGDERRLWFCSILCQGNALQKWCMRCSLAKHERISCVRLSERICSKCPECSRISAYPGSHDLGSTWWQQSCSPSSLQAQFARLSWSRGLLHPPSSSGGCTIWYGRSQ